MKKLFLLGAIMALLHPLAAFAGPNKGDTAPRPDFIEILSETQGVNWDSYKGKVILIEAWATW